MFSLFKIPFKRRGAIFLYSDLVYRCRLFWWSKLRCLRKNGDKTHSRKRRESLKNSRNWNFRRRLCAWKYFLLSVQPTFTRFHYALFFFFFPSSTLLLSFLRLLLSTISYFLPPIFLPLHHLLLVRSLSLPLWKLPHLHPLSFPLFSFFPSLVKIRRWRTVHCQGSFLQPLSFFLNRPS